VGLSVKTDPQCIAVDGLTNAAERKLRIHPKEAGHSIEDLPLLSHNAGSDKLSAAEILKSLGLEVNGGGEGAEVWYVGVSEQIGDGHEEAGSLMKTTGALSGEVDGNTTMQ
jgi:hypothetical protein